jgi:hypothetical protein
LNREFDYNKKILVAVEFGKEPTRLTNMPETYDVFKRVAIPEVIDAFGDTVNWLVRKLVGKQFRRVLNQRMGYWETRIPMGQSCFVHYVRDSSEIIQSTFQRLKALSKDWALLGIYHMEPQSSAYPFAFPTGIAPNHWELGQTRSYTKDSIFWFNFFPAQDYLFEKTVAVWILFNSFKGREGGECNQLVSLESKDTLEVHGVDEFVQVNLNRFTSFAGFFRSVREAGRHSFTQDTSVSSH